MTTNLYHYDSKMPCVLCRTARLVCGFLNAPLRQKMCCTPCIMCSYLSVLFFCVCLSDAWRTMLSCPDHKSRSSLMPKQMRCVRGVAVASCRRCWTRDCLLHVQIDVCWTYSASTCIFVVLCGLHVMRRNIFTLLNTGYIKKYVGILGLTKSLHNDFFRAHIHD